MPKSVDKDASSLAINYQLFDNLDFKQNLPNVNDCRDLSGPAECITKCRSV